MGIWPVPPIVVAFIPPLGFSCLDAIAAYMVNMVGMPVFQVMGIRNTIAATALFAYLYGSGDPDAPLGPKGARQLLWFRGALMTACLVLVYISLEYLTIAEFWMVNSCTPFPTAILCWWLLSERFTRTQGVCCVLSISGVLLITNPLAPASTPGSVDDHIVHSPLYKLLGVSLAVPAIILVGVEVVVMRKMGDSVSHLQVLASLAMVPALVSLLALVIGHAPLAWPRNAFEWVLLTCTVPCGWLAQFTLTYATQRLSGVTMIMTAYTGLVHSTVIQWLLYGNLPNLITTGGIAIIVIAGLYAAVYGQASETPYQPLSQTGEEGSEGRDGDLELDPVPRQGG